MKKYIKYTICTFGFLLVFNGLSLAQSPTIKDLINNPQKYDNKKVLIEGEVIGHIMKRGDHVWFNINDTTTSIGIWAKAEIADKIQYLGKHAARGDLVRVDGVFYAPCPMHGGDVDIHADSLMVVKTGIAKQLSHNPRKVNILILLTGLMVCLYIIKILKRKR